MTGRKEVPIGGGWATMVPRENRENRSRTNGPQPPLPYEPRPVSIPVDVASGGAAKGPDESFLRPIRQPRNPGTGFGVPSYPPRQRLPPAPKQPIPNLPLRPPTRYGRIDGPGPSTVTTATRRGGPQQMAPGYQGHPGNQGQLVLQAAEKPEPPPIVHKLMKDMTINYSYLGEIDLPIWHAIWSYSKKTIAANKQLAIVPKMSLARTKTTGMLETDEQGWEVLRKVATANNITLIYTHLSKIQDDVLTHFQFEEKGTDADAFHEFKRQKRLLHMSVSADMFGRTFLREGYIPGLKSLRLINFSLEGKTEVIQFITAMTQLCKHMTYLLLDFVKYVLTEKDMDAELLDWLATIRPMLNIRALSLRRCAVSTWPQCVEPAVRLERLLRFKLMECPTIHGELYAKVIEKEMRKIAYLTLIRTCMPDEAAAIIDYLEPGLTRVHLEFNHGEGQFDVSALLKHKNTLKVLWIETSTAGAFEVVENAHGNTIRMGDFLPFDGLQELAIAVDFEALAQEDFDWYSPPNLNAFRILNTHRGFAHANYADVTDDAEACYCQIAELFAHRHKSCFPEGTRMALKFIAIGKNSDGNPWNTPSYFLVKQDSEVQMMEDPKCIRPRDYIIECSGVQVFPPETDSGYGTTCFQQFCRRASLANLQYGPPAATGITGGPKPQDIIAGFQSMQLGQAMGSGRRTPTPRDYASGAEAKSILSGKSGRSGITSEVDSSPFTSPKSFGKKSQTQATASGPRFPGAQNQGPQAAMPTQRFPGKQSQVPQAQGIQPTKPKRHRRRRGRNNKGKEKAVIGFSSPEMPESIFGGSDITNTTKPGLSNEYSSDADTENLDNNEGFEEGAQGPPDVLCIRVSVEYCVAHLHKHTLFQVDRMGAAFWHTDEMVMDQGDQRPPSAYIPGF